MVTAIMLGVMFIAAAWAVGAYFIWHFGPGERQRTVWCPVLKKRATIVAVQREARFKDSYAGLSVVDVKKCSLLDGGLVSCHRECIRPRAHAA